MRTDGESGGGAGGSGLPNCDYFAIFPSERDTLSFKNNDRFIQKRKLRFPGHQISWASE